MAKLSSAQKVQKRLVENITLLWTLCEVPGKPKENETRRGHDEGRQLPRDRERQLVDSFAFISASTDSALRVMAVCIEEDSDRNGMTICLASNTGDLSHVTQGFNGIARTLEQASLRKKSRIDIRKDLFRQIVTLDESRILSRLRSSHAKRSRKTEGKPELLPLLSRSVHDVSIVGRNETARALITSIRSNAKGLAQRFSDFERARGNDHSISVSQDMLIEILIETDEFDVDGLRTVLAMSRTLNPNLKASILRAMSKIGRYIRIACELINAARSPDYTLFRRISVRPIEKPRFDMAFIADHLIGFDQAAQRVTGSSHQHLLNAYGSTSLAAARTNFNSRMSDCLVRWKVHAEVQLLLFYEQQPHVSRPRIIGSSKSACYLCDLFIQLHGGFGIPRTHGRLYDRWILPEHAINGHLVSVIDKLNAALEAKIKNTLRSRTRPLPHPNESVLHLGQPWSSNSTLAEPREQASIQEIVDTVHENTSYERTVHESPSRDQTEPPSNTSPCSPITPTAAASQDEPIAKALVDNVPPDLHPTQPTEVIRRLSLGDSTTHNLINPQDISQDESIAQAHVDNVHVPLDLHPTQPTQVIRRLSLGGSTAHKLISPQDTSQDEAVAKSQVDNVPPDIHPTQPTEVIRRLSLGDSTTHRLINPQDVLIIETGPIRLHASRDIDALNRTSEYGAFPCWIHVQWSAGDIHAVDDENFESVDVDLLAEDSDTIVEAGAALSSKELALQIRGHTIVIKYTFEDAETR